MNPLDTTFREDLERLMIKKLPLSSCNVGLKQQMVKIGELAKPTHPILSVGFT